MAFQKACCSVSLRSAMTLSIQDCINDNTQRLMAMNVPWFPALICAAGKKKWKQRSSFPYIPVATPACLALLINTHTSTCVHMPDNIHFLLEISARISTSWFLDFIWQG